MQHVNIKVFAESAADIRLADAIPVFHRWIQSGDLPELLIDVADYSHVPAGPGVVLIAHEANYSLDSSRNRLGLLYNRKAAANGEGLQQAYDAAVSACRRLEQEPEFQGKLKFDPRKLEITWNDRLLHPNTDSGWEAVRHELTGFLDGVLGAGTYRLARASDPRERLRVTVTK